MRLARLLLALLVILAEGVAAADDNGTERKCRACEAMVDMIQQVRKRASRLVVEQAKNAAAVAKDLAIKWRPTKDSRRKKLKRTRKALSKACGSFKGFASLNEDGKTKFVDFNKFMSQ